MRAAFWVSLAVIAYTYVGYPGIMYLLSHFCPRPWNRTPIDLSVSIVMAVHNGGSLLQDKIEHLVALEPDRVKEVIIVSDGSNDETAQILASVRNSRIHSIILTEHCGKAAALNHAVAAATGEILLFVDIRPRIAPGALTALLSNFADPSVGCVTGELLLDTSENDVASKAVGGLYWRYEQWIRNCEAAFDSPVGVYGGFYAARRTLVTPFPAGLILDDMFQPLALVRQGYRSVLDRSACVIDRWPSRVGGEFHRKIRTLAGNYQLIVLAPWILSLRNRLLFQLVSHKLMRLVVPYLFVVLLVSATCMGIHSTVWASVAALECAFWGMSVLALCVSTLGLQPFAAASGALLILNAAAVAGLYKFLFTRGPLWKIWSTGRSLRVSRVPSQAEQEGI